MSRIQDITVPSLGESISEATLLQWLKKEGDFVEEDEPIAELETDKVNLEVNAPITGILSDILVKKGATVEVGTIIGHMKEEAPKPHTKEPAKKETSAPQQPASPKPTPSKPALTPSLPPEFPKESFPPSPSEKDSERVPLSRLRQRIAERLKEAQNTAAILTTFNEVDMSRIISLREQLKSTFEEKHHIKLGFMSFFVKACLVGLKEIPILNASIEGDDIVYRKYYNISVAVSTPQGLVVPVVRNANEKSFAQIERDIAHLSQKAREGNLALEDLLGGTFTISNGGIYGSLLSTPILNPPQSGILGMHKIQERPVAINGKVEVRPMMYLALSYDHRLIDGQEAVTFLVRVKECLENPERVLLEV